MKYHDLCIEASHVELVERFSVEKALSNVNKVKVLEQWRKSLSDLEPPVNSVEMNKYNCSEWINEKIN